MKETPIGWFYEFEEKLHPDRISFEQDSQSDLMNLIESLKRQVKAFRTLFVGQLGQSKKQAKVSLMQIISTSNTIYNYLTVSKRANKHHSTLVRAQVGAQIKKTPFVGLFLLICYTPLILGQMLS